MTRWERQLFESGQITADELHKRIKKRGIAMSRQELINALLLAWIVWSIVAMALSGNAIVDVTAIVILVTSVALWRWNNKGGKK